MTDSFVSFLKQATRFYRSLVHRLIVHFHLRELNWVLQKFRIPSEISLVTKVISSSADGKLTVDPPDQETSYNSQVRDQVIRSCHRTMIYLGDLSRYREFGRTTKNYGPAIGYYTLAKELLPTSGETLSKN